MNTQAAIDRIEDKIRSEVGFVTKDLHDFLLIELKQAEEFARRAGYIKGYRDARLSELSEKKECHCLEALHGGKHHDHCEKKA